MVLLERASSPFGMMLDLEKLVSVGGKDPPLPLMQTFWAAMISQ
jgi:hypothetical protein